MSVSMWHIQRAVAAGAQVSVSIFKITGIHFQHTGACETSCTASDGPSVCKDGILLLVPSLERHQITRCQQLPTPAYDSQVEHCVAKI